MFSRFRLEAVGRLQLSLWARRRRPSQLDEHPGVCSVIDPSSCLHDDPVPTVCGRHPDIEQTSLMTR